jgi:hypothetical protein
VGGQLCLAVAVSRLHKARRQARTMFGRHKFEAMSCRLFYAATLITISSAFPSLATDDVLVQAVSFAITGSDASPVVSVDRQHCIFRVNSNTYYLDNIYTNRIAIRNLKNQLGQFWSVVEIHGKEKVVDIANHPVQEPRVLTEALKNYYRELYDANSTSVSDHTIRVDTHESDRLVKAWQYIYAHGCKGMTSPF